LTNHAPLESPKSKVERR